MNINRNNCESWFLDFYEGNLSDGQVQELFAFLEMHPDLREAFDSYEAVSFDPDQLIHFDAKESLKKPVENSGKISESNYEEFMVGAVEGTLSADEMKQLEIFLAANADKREELELLRQTILEPETDLVFENKESLKKTVLITEENFESFALDYAEGTLKGETLRQFEKYLEAHPELKAELNAFGELKLQPDASVVFDAKDSLKHKTLVNAENFETFAVDYIEGNLSGETLIQFEHFLAANPELKKEIALFNQTKLQPEAEIVFEDKSSLKRKVLVVSADNFDEIAVASLEGQLNAEEEKIFAAYVASNPEAEKAVAIYSKTKLQPETEIVFADKDSLRRKKRGGFFWTSNISYAAAAAVALLIGIFWWMNSGNVDPKADENGIALIDKNGNQNDSVKTKKQPEDSFILPKVEDHSQLADNGSAPKHNQSYVSDPKNNPELNKTGMVKEEFVSFQSGSKLNLKARPVNSDLNFSSAFYTNVPVSKPEGKEPISAGQFAMRWMKDKLDQPVDEDELPESPIARNPNEDRNVTGFDLTSSAINRIGQSTGGKLHLEKSEEGTVLTFGKYDILLSKNR